MKNILVVNNKGGSGKSTIATNLAAYYANCGLQVMLVDADSQASSSDWLAARPVSYPAILGVAGFRFKTKLDLHAVIYDVPAAMPKARLQQAILRADVLLLPVMPSPIDMRALARFLEELQVWLKGSPLKVGIIANRAKGNTNIFRELDAELERLHARKNNIEYITALRAHPNYLQAAAQGIGIHELAASQTEVDREEWRPLIEWLDW